MHIALHTALRLCLWNVLAVLILGIAVVLLAVHFVKQKQRKTALETAGAAAVSTAARRK